ncbi:MAG TPA: NTP transferase domain-containing protein, partial [Geobacteraceae bacterium]|nr:NTP transferase domain-containing protein [Geobacteraceae bacterium]
MTDTAAIVLAAGKGTRMKSGLVKVMHMLGGCPMIAWPVNAARAAGVARTVVVTGFQGEKVRDYFADAADIAIALQDRQLGTGHAVACAAPAFKGFTGSVLILCGDVPLIQPATLRSLLDFHETGRATLTVLTACPEDPSGYGRIVKGNEG